MRPVAEWVKQAKREGFSEEAVERVFEAESFNVARATRHAEDWFSLFNSLGLCHRLYISRFYYLPTIAELFSALTGFDLSSAEILEGAERAWNIYKAVNVRAGFSRLDDEPPPKWFEPLKGLDREYRLTDYYGRVQLTKEDVEAMLDDYYDERGWDRETSAPAPQKLRELGLEKIAQDMEEYLSR
jgi:aldehyde:ferredoxin oxidoreductase